MAASKNPALTAARRRRTQLHARLNRAGALGLTKKERRAITGIIARLTTWIKLNEAR